MAQKVRERRRVMQLVKVAMLEVKQSVPLVFTMGNRAERVMVRITGEPRGAKTLGYSREEGSFLVGVRNTGDFS